MEMMEFNVMDQTGHSKHLWDVDQPHEVDAAREMFNSLKKKGYKAFHVKKDGEEGKQMDAFDPLSGKFIMVPPIVGG